MRNDHWETFEINQVIHARTVNHGCCSGLIITDDTCTRNNLGVKPEPVPQAILICVKVYSSRTGKIPPLWREGRLGMRFRIAKDGSGDGEEERAIVSGAGNHSNHFHVLGAFRGGDWWGLLCRPWQRAPPPKSCRWVLLQSMSPRATAGKPYCFPIFLGARTGKCFKCEGRFVRDLYHI